MKRIFTFLFLALSFAAQAQDSTQQSLTVTLPKKALWAYAYYQSQSVSSDSFSVMRKLPDYLASKVGSNANPDSLITLQVKAKLLATFLNTLQGERNEAVRDFYRSVLFNQPSITGYTSLQAQITTKANGNGADKKPAQYILQSFLDYQNALQALWNDQLQRGIDWIKN